MKYTIVLDSSASLPEALVNKRPIQILPLTIYLDGEPTPDYTSQKKLLEIYASGKINVNADIQTSPPTVEEMNEYFLHNIVPHYDVAICQTVSKTISTTYDNISAVANSITLDSRELRDGLGIDHPFRMTYMSTGTTGAGQGLVAIYADTVLSRGMDYNKYKVNVEKFKSVAKGFAVVKDIVYARHRSRQRGVNALSLPTAVIGKAVGLSPIVLNHMDTVTPVALQVGFSKAVNRLFTYALDRINDGLYLKCINISIAGSPSELNRYPAFIKLRDTAKKSGVTLLVGVMSLGTTINFSPGCIALGIAPKNQKAIP